MVLLPVHLFLPAFLLFSCIVLTPPHPTTEYKLHDGKDLICLILLSLSLEAPRIAPGREGIPHIFAG